MSALIRDFTWGFGGDGRPTPGTPPQPPPTPFPPPVPPPATSTAAASAHGVAEAVRETASSNAVVRAAAAPAPVLRDAGAGVIPLTAAAGPRWAAEAACEEATNRVSVRAAAVGAPTVRNAAGAPALPPDPQPGSAAPPSPRGAAFPQPGWAEHADDVRLGRAGGSAREATPVPTSRPVTRGPGLEGSGPGLRTPRRYAEFLVDGAR